MACNYLSHNGQDGYQHCTSSSHVGVAMFKKGLARIFTSELDSTHKLALAKVSVVFYHYNNQRLRGILLLTSINASVLVTISIFSIHTVYQSA